MEEVIEKVATGNHTHWFNWEEVLASYFFDLGEPLKR